MATTTPLQGLPIPEETDTPDVPASITALAIALEKRLVQKYSTTAERSTANPTPDEGQFAYVAEDNTFWLYDGTQWAQLYLYTTPRPTITTSSANPTGGVDGDIWFKI